MKRLHRMCGYELSRIRILSTRSLDIRWPRVIEEVKDTRDRSVSNYSITLSTFARTDVGIENREIRANTSLTLFIFFFNTRKISRVAQDYRTRLGFDSAQSAEIPEAPRASTRTSLNLILPHKHRHLLKSRVARTIIITICTALYRSTTTM